MPTTAKTTKGKGKSPKKVEEKSPGKSKGKYIFGLGRRKTATAKVKLFLSGKGEIMVNGRDFKDYFPTYSLQRVVLQPLDILGIEKKADLELQVKGGGVSAQADAARLAVSRALVKDNQDVKTVLKKEDLMTRDARKKERKKPGLKRARRAPQWAKR